MIDLEKQAIQHINKAKKILLVLASQPSSDAVGSALAWKIFLEKMDKGVTVVCSGTDFKDSNWLPGFSAIKPSLNNVAKFIVSVPLKDAKVEQVKYLIEDGVLNFIISPKEGFFSKEEVKASYSGYQYDLVISLGSPDFEALGTIYDKNIDFFYKTTVINIDHSPYNEEYGQINLLDLSAVSVSEICYFLMKTINKDLVNEDIATCLLFGIISKTKSFKTTNITPRSLSYTSELVNIGAKREEIVNRLYRLKDLKTLKIWGRVLNCLKNSSDGKLVYASLYRNDFLDLEASETDLTEVVDELIATLPKANLVALFYSQTERRFSSQNFAEAEKAEAKDQSLIQASIDKPFSSKLLLYAFKNTNAAEILKNHDFVGGRRFASLKSDKPLKQFEKEMISLIQDNLAQID